MIEGVNVWRAALLVSLTISVLGCMPAGRDRSVLDGWMTERFAGVVAQRYQTSCAAAAASTLLSVDCGDPLTEAEAIAWMLADRRTRDLVSPVEAGFSMADILRLLRARGVKTVPYRGDVDEFVAAGRTVLVRVVRQGVAHFTLVVGMDARRVYLADSIDGRISVTHAEFAAWRDGSPYFLVVDAMCDHRQRARMSAP